MISLRWGAFDIDRMTDNRNMQLTVVSSRPELGGIVPILLENPESRLDFNRDKNIPIVYTNDQSFSQELPYDPIRRTFLAPGRRRAHPAHPPLPPCLRAWPAVNSVSRGKVFVIQTLDKVDSAVSVTLLPGITFLLINGL